MRVIDTSGQTVDDVANELSEWIEEKRELFRAPDDDWVGMIGIVGLDAFDRSEGDEPL